jgi:hypothetical protein
LAMPTQYALYACQGGIGFVESEVFVPCSSIVL